MNNLNEFKERIQFLLAEALNPPKKQQCLIEFNRLLVANKSDQHQKIVLQVLETQRMNEVNLRALKISVQVQKYDLNSSLRAATIINKAFNEGTEVIYQLCGECYRLLANSTTINSLSDLLCNLALKLTSQPIQIGSTISLHYLLQFEVLPNTKKLIQQAYIKNQLICHQSMVEIMIKITTSQDSNLVQILQRSLAALQEQRHTYQVKQTLCKFMLALSDYQIYDDNLLLQCVTILRETTFDRVVTVQQAAKLALQSYQNLYIARNPPQVTTSSYFPDVKPFIKKKRGDGHLVLNAEKYKKMQISQVKQQLEKIQEKVTEQKIQDSLIDQFIQQEQKQSDLQNQEQIEEIQSDQDQNEEITENINPQLQDTQLFVDEKIEETQDFTEDYYEKVLDLVEDCQIDQAFKLALYNNDDFLIIQLMMTVKDYFSELSNKTAEQLIKKFNAIYKSNFVEDAQQRNAQNWINKLIIKIYMIILFFLLQISNNKLIAPRKVIHAIDCGNYIDTRTSSGIKYKSDHHYIGTSEIVDYYEQAENRKIKFTDDQSLYITQRQGQSFAYTIPIGNEVPENQTYVLVLKFAELHYEESNSRVFNVLLGKKMILQNIDILQLVGSFTAHTEYIEIIIDGGAVYYQGEPCFGALNNRNELVVGFSATQDLATIAALFLFKGPLKDTDYEDKQMFQERWIQRNTPKTNDEIKKQNEERIKNIEQEIKEKQNILKIREGFGHEIDIEEIKIPQKKTEWPEFSFQLLFILLKTPLGAVLLVGFLTVCFVTISFVFFDPYGQNKLKQQYQEIKKQKNIKQSTIPKKQVIQKTD
ncbi:unnamed protein product [Paramecium primaurelia]|uniref:Malectin domain-containing protein n=1 Tax=Paramecium primaurelia TaxID=5886 RepID=A0A8S1MEG8_PARPR|nr:unnamed protein product [Paramecium primaurelia]